MLPIQGDLRQFLEPPKTGFCHLLAHLGVKSSIKTTHPEAMYFPEASLFLLSFPVVRAPQWSTWWLFKTPTVDEWLMDYMAVSSSLPEAKANSLNESSCHYCFLSACWNCPGPLQQIARWAAPMSFWSSTMTMFLVMKTGGHAGGGRRQVFLA